MLIKELLSPCVSSERIFHETEGPLFLAGCNPEAINGICQEALDSLKYLKSLSESSDEPNEEELRNFLNKRWNTVRNTDASYTCYPQSPINRVCLAIAQHLAKPDEPIAQVLMPTLTVTNYDIWTDTLISLTETQNAAGQRELNLSSFLISENGKAIIPIQAWFESQIQNTGEFYNHLYSEKGQLIPFTEHEKFLIQQSAAPNSMTFLDEFSLRKKLMSAKGTLAEAVLKLCDDLMKNGAASRKGTVLQAGNQVYPLITDFMLIWYKKLTAEQRKTLGALRASRDRQTFETHLLILRSAANSEHLPPLTKEQLDSIRGMETCVEVNSRAIHDILEAHPDQFSKIILAKTTKSSDTELQTFDVLLESIKEKLNQRKMYIQQCSDDALKLLYPETRNKLGEKLDEIYYALHGVSKTQLLHAINRHDEAAVKKMLPYIKDINSFSSPVKSILNSPLNRSNFAITALLLNAGAKLSPLDITQKNSARHTHLFYAVCSSSNGAEEVACALINAGADLSDTTLLLKCWGSGREQIIAALLNRPDIDLFALNSEGHNALYYAVINNNANLVRILASKGMNINEPIGLQSKAVLPIGLALDHHHEPTLIALLELGAKFDLKNAKGVSPLEAFIIRRYMHTPQATARTELIQRGAALALRQWPDRVARSTACISLFETALFNSWSTLTQFLLQQNPNALSEMLALNEPAGERFLLSSMLEMLIERNSAASFPRRRAYLKEVITAIAQRKLGDEIFYDRRSQAFSEVRFTFPELLALPRNGHVNFWMPSINAEYITQARYIHECIDCSPAETIFLFACALEWSLRLRPEPQVLAFADNLCQAINRQDLSKVCSLMIHTKSTSSLGHYRIISPLLRTVWNRMPASLQEIARANLPPESTCFPKLFSRRARVIPLAVTLEKTEDLRYTL